MYGILTVGGFRIPGFVWTRAPRICAAVAAIPLISTVAATDANKGPNSTSAPPFIARPCIPLLPFPCSSTAQRQQPTPGAPTHAVLPTTAAARRLTLLD